MAQPVVLKKRYSLKGLPLLPVIRKVKDGRLENVKELARISVGKRTETMQLRDIAKAVVDITVEPMNELLESAGKLCILNRLALVIFSLEHLIWFNYIVAIIDIKCLVDIVACKVCLVGKDI